MTMLRPLGKRLIFWGALIMTCWAGYELYIRLDAMSKPLGMFIAMWRGEQIPLPRAMMYVDWTILRIPGYLATCVLAGLWGLLFHRRKTTPWLMLLFSIGLALWGGQVQALLLPSLWDLVKMLPLLLILFGAVFSILGQLLPGKKVSAQGAASADEPLFPPRR